MKLQENGARQNQHHDWVLSNEIKQSNLLSAAVANFAPTVYFNHLLERYRNYYYTLVNIKNAFVENTIHLGINQGIYSSLSNLSSKSDEKIFSSKTAHLIADSAFLAGMVYLECSPTSIAAYILSAGSRYIPDLLLSEILTDKFSEPVKAVLSSNYTPTVLGLAAIGWQIHQGASLTPMLASKLAADLGGLIGGEIGDKIGKINARVANPIVRVALDCYHARNANKNGNTNAVNNENTGAEEKVISNEVSNEREKEGMVVDENQESEQRKIARQFIDESSAKKSSYCQSYVATDFKRYMPFTLFSDKANNSLAENANNTQNMQVEYDQRNLQLD